jgi:hypothetical protein
MDTLTIDPTGAQFHDLQHSRWTQELTIYNPRGGQTYNRPTGSHDLQHSKWTYLHLTPQGLNSTIYNTRGGQTIDPTGAQFHDLQHSRWTHLQLTPQGLTIYNTRGGHTYNRPHRGPILRPTTLEVDTLTIDTTGAHDLQHSRWTHLQLTPHGLNSTIWSTRGGHTYN